MAAARAPASPGATSNPFSPSCTTSGTPPTLVAMTGVPTASDSTTACGKFSQVEEKARVGRTEEAEHVVARSGRAALARRAVARRRGAPSPPALAHRPRRVARRLPPAPPPAPPPATSGGRSARQRQWSAHRCRRAPAPLLASAGGEGRAPGSGSPGRGRRTPHDTAMSRRYALGQTTRVACRNAASRDRRRARMRTSPPACWNASRSPS